jgi:hypothetical protein
MRIPGKKEFGRPEAHLVQRLDHAINGLPSIGQGVYREWLSDSVEYGKPWIEGLVRVLEDNLGMTAESLEVFAPIRRNILSQKTDLAGSGIIEL